MQYEAYVCTNARRFIFFIPVCYYNVFFYFRNLINNLIECTTNFLFCSFFYIEYYLYDLLFMYRVNNDSSVSFQLILLSFSLIFCKQTTACKYNCLEFPIIYLFVFWLCWHCSIVAVMSVPLSIIFRLYHEKRGEVPMSPYLLLITCIGCMSCMRSTVPQRIIYSKCYLLNLKENVSNAKRSFFNSM